MKDDERPLPCSTRKTLTSGTTTTPLFLTRLNDLKNWKQNQTLNVFGAQGYYQQKKHTRIKTLKGINLMSKRGGDQIGICDRQKHKDIAY